VVGQHRSTQRHPVKIVSIEEGKLRNRLREIAAEHIRWGRRMAYRLLRREGWTVNHKRVQRLWREGYSRSEYWLVPGGGNANPVAHPLRNFSSVKNAIFWLTRTINNRRHT
jgi:hypothetical protein